MDLQLTKEGRERERMYNLIKCERHSSLHLQGQGEIFSSFFRLFLGGGGGFILNYTGYRYVSIYTHVYVRGMDYSSYSRGENCMLMQNLNVKWSLLSHSHEFSLGSASLLD